MDSFDVGTAIIGSGFSGLGMAIRLKQEGIEDFVVLERGDDVGGTWHYNTYPGCACDVPSHLYSFSFAPNPDWSETYSRQPEIRDYLQRAAPTSTASAPHVRLNCTVERHRVGRGRRRWTIETSDGPLRARVVVAGMGPLAEPKTPPTRGARRLRGRDVPLRPLEPRLRPHRQARRRHRHRRVGDPVRARDPDAGRAAARDPAHPAVDHAAPEPRRSAASRSAALRRASRALQKLVRGGVYAGRELLVLGFVKHPKLMKVAEKIARRHMQQPDLRPGAAREGHAGLHDRLQADPAVEPAGTARSASPTSSC